MRKKSRLNCEMICKTWKKVKSNSEKIWTIWKKDSRCRHNVEIPPKTRYKQKQNETNYENITH